MAKICARALPGAAAVVLGAGLAASGSALTINLTFNAGSTDQFVDPFGVNRTNELHDVIEAAASIWEDIVETSHTLNINYWWDDLDDSTIGLHNLTAQSGGRETAGNIRFDTLSTSGTARRYYFDPTPFDDSEFDMQQTLWRDMSAGQQTDFFNGTAQDTFEVGYQGTAFAGSVADARLGFDLLTVALHEIGHALGMSSANDATVAETGDGDYDFSTAFTGGVALASEVADGGNIAHLDCGFCLMFPSVSTGLRSGVSTTDALSSASGADWGVLDLPRKEFIQASGSSWATTLNWIGGAAPGSADDVYVRSGRTAVLTASGFGDNVFVSEAGNININAGGTLFVSGDATVSGLDSDFVVATGGELQVAGRLFVQDDAQVFMSGGLVDLNGGATIDAGADITGFGTVDVAGQSLNNNGEIIASGGLLTLQSVGVGLLDLDGTSGSGILRVTSGDMTVTGTQLDDFNGQMIVGSTRTLTLSSPWTLADGGLLGNDGLLDLNGGATDPATLAGGLATIAGDVQVSGVGFINALAAFESTAEVSVASGGRLELNNSFTMSGGSYTGLGEIQVDGIMTVAASTTIDVTTFDWDGFSGTTQTFVNNNSLLTINSDFIDDGNNLYDGTVTLNGGSDLTINTTNSWNLFGLMTLNGGSVVDGQALTVNGDIDSNSANTINSDVMFAASSTVSLAAAGDVLSLAGSINYAGGSYTGLGRLVHIGDAVVSADTTIAVGVLDWDGGGLSSTMINAGRTLTLNVGTVDVGNDLFDGVVNINSGAALSVNTTANSWTNSGTVNLAGGSLLGDLVLNADTITGFGTVTADIENNGAITASGGTLTLNAPTTIDIDGAKPGEVGVLNALAGNISVVAEIGPAYEGTMNIGAGRSINLNANELFNGGEINMTGGALVTPNLQQNAVLNVSGSTATIQAATAAFGGASDNTISSRLVLTGTTTVAATAMFDGGGTLQNNGTLSGSFGGEISIENRGMLNPGTSPGVITLDGDFVNRSNGTVNFELNGLGANQYDRINITGDASLDGTFNVTLGGFVPDWGDTWSIMSYSSVTEILDVVSFTALGDPLLLWWYEATPTSFDVGVRHIADVNHDGAINFEDLNIVVSFFNMFGDDLAGDADEDGDVDFADLNYVVSFFNTFAPPNLIPTPGSATLLALALTLGVGRRRR